MEIKYVKPEFHAAAFTCLHCGAYAHQEWSKVFFVEKDLPVGKAHDVVANVALCQACGNISLWGLRGDILFPSENMSGPIPNADMPECVAQLYKEAMSIYMQSPRAACALLRLSVERLCFHLVHTSGILKEKIGNLISVKQLPDSVFQALELVRLVGNKAVHPGEIQLDVDDKDTAIALMKLLNYITAYTITLPTSINNMNTGLLKTIK